MGIIMQGSYMMKLFMEKKNSQKTILFFTLEKITFLSFFLEYARMNIVFKEENLVKK